MNANDLYRTETDKSPAQFSRDLEAALGRKGFIISNKASMDMAAAFAAHGVATEKGFDLHMIQVCKPEKAAKSLGANPERSVLMPKFVMAFSEGGTTSVRFLRFAMDDIRGVVDDAAFPDSLAESYAVIVKIIEEAC